MIKKDNIIQQLNDEIETLKERMEHALSDSHREVIESRLRDVHRERLAVTTAIVEDLKALGY